MRGNGAQEVKVLPLLLVTAEDQHEELLRLILAEMPCAIRRVNDCGEAQQVLSELKPGVVLLEADRPAGKWKRLLEDASSLPWPPEFIVFSGLADDRLWAEVLSLGGYDVLPIPFRSEEVLRTVSLAGDAQARRAPTRSAHSATAA